MKIYVFRTLSCTGCSVSMSCREYLLGWRLVRPVAMSCPSCPVSYVSCSDPSVLARLSCPSCPVPTALLRQRSPLLSLRHCRVLAFLSQLSWPSFPVLAALSWLSCPSCLVPAVLSQLFIPAVLFRLSCPSCPDPTVPFPLSCPGCPVSAVLPRHPVHSFLEAFVMPRQ
jgi:hypothetical protein